MGRDLPPWARIRSSVHLAKSIIGVKALLSLHNNNPMPPKKKTKVAGLSTDDVAVTIDKLDDVLANIFGFLDGPKEIMGKRCVRKKWKEAVKKTIVPPTNFLVNSWQKYQAMGVMTRALPNLQHIVLCDLGPRNKYGEGEDPDESHAARTDDYIPRDVRIISNLCKLRVLKIWEADLNGRYPVLFNFPLLQSLTIQHCKYLKFDLDMLAGLPSLKEFYSYDNRCMTGNINSLRVLKETVEKVYICNSDNVGGNFMDLADFPHLKELYLEDTTVTGDIRDIGENDFSSLEEQLILPNGVYGSASYKLQRISDGHDLVRAVYLLHKQRPILLDIKEWIEFEVVVGRLSEHSPDWYRSAASFRSAPFSIHFVQAGPRIGYRWQNKFSNSCEVNWLDPEPDRESSEYEEYIEELLEAEGDLEMYRGLHQPPTEEEYNRLLQRIADENISLLGRLLED
jgi:hypothetical protein